MNTRIDITALWNKFHDHLKILDVHLPLKKNEYLECSNCHSHSAIKIKANLRFGSDYWANEVIVYACKHCKSFAVDFGDYNLHKAKAAELSQDKGPDQDFEISAVDARLWSSQPKVLNIEPTTHCNFSCWYCVGREMKQDHLTMDNYIKILDNFPELEVVALVGEGEPILNPDFLDMVKIAKDRGLRVVSLSNGSVFSKNNIPKICDSGLDYIGISIDSTDPETFASSRIDGDLNQVLKCIKALSDYKKEHGLRYPILGVKGSLFTHTIDEYEDILIMAKEAGIEVFESFQALNPKQSYVKIYPEENKKLLATSSNIAHKINQKIMDAHKILPNAATVLVGQEQMPLMYSGPGNGLRNNCNEMWLYSLLSGDVTPCCQIKDVLHDKWNLAENSASDILSQRYYERVRFNLWNGIFLHRCSGCSKT